MAQQQEAGGVTFWDVPYPRVGLNAARRPPGAATPLYVPRPQLPPLPLEVAGPAPSGWATGSATGSSEGGGAASEDVTLGSLGSSDDDLSAAEHAWDCACAACARELGSSSSGAELGSLSSSDVGGDADGWSSDDGFAYDGRRGRPSILVTRSPAGADGSPPARVVVTRRQPRGASRGVAEDRLVRLTARELARLEAVLASPPPGGRGASPEPAPRRGAASGGSRGASPLRTVRVESVDRAIARRLRSPPPPPPPPPRPPAVQRPATAVGRALAADRRGDILAMEASIQRALSSMATLNELTLDSRRRLSAAASRVAEAAAAARRGRRALERRPPFQV